VDEHPVPNKTIRPIKNGIKFLKEVIFLNINKITV
jgi:hypothetical protein